MEWEMVKNLSTNFKDDIINTDVNERRKYRMVQNDDGTVSFEDVTDYLQEGNPFGGKEINNANKEFNQLLFNIRENFRERDPLIFETGLPGTLVKYYIYTKDEDYYGGWAHEEVIVNKKISGKDNEEEISSVYVPAEGCLELIIYLEEDESWSKRCYPITVQPAVEHIWWFFKTFEIMSAIPDKNRYGNSIDTEPFKYLRIIIRNKLGEQSKLLFFELRVVGISNRYFM
jgi:hypothetical protein